MSWGSRLVHRLAGRAAYGPVVLAEPGRPGRRATQRWGIVQLLGSAGEADAAEYQCRRRRCRVVQGEVLTACRCTCSGDRVHRI